MATALTIAAAVGAAAIGGVFFAFSAMVMPALDRLGAARAADVMRAINVVAVTPPFLSVFLGSAVLGIAAAAAGDDAALQGVAAVLYLGGVVGLTGAFHVPRNEALARGELEWPAYARPWAAGNHVRAAAAIAAAALHGVALA